MLKKMMCAILALSLCFMATAEDFVVSDSTDAEVIPAEAVGSLYTQASDAAEDDIPLVEQEACAPKEEADRADFQASETADAEGGASNAAPKLTLSASKLTIGVGENCEVLKAVLTPEDDSQTITWSSDNKKIAEVGKKTGVITGVKTGTTKIRAKASNGLEKTCKVTVRNAPKKVALAQSETTLSVGETFVLKATLPSKTGSTLTFSSNKKKVAVVDALSGEVTAVAPGTAKITVKTFNGKKDSCVVTVVAEPDQVFLPETLTLSEKEHRFIAASVVDENGAPSVASYIFSAENGTGEITVDAQTGEVVGVSAGTAYIRVCTHNGVSTHLTDSGRVETVCAVTVTEGPEKVKLADDSITIGIGQQYRIEPVILDKNGDVMKDVAYTVASSAPKKLSVSQDGVLKGVNKGSFTVTVTAYNGVKATCKVSVVNKPSKVSLSPKSPVICIGETSKLKVSFPKNTMASCIFSSSAKDVVAVDDEGNITGLKEGSAVVKVRTHNSKTDKVTVKVTRGPEFISLNGDYELEFDELTQSYRVVYNKTLKVGQSFQITYENEYSTGGSIAGYISDNPDVAEVSSKGLVKAKEPGTADISVYSAGGAVATLRVTVPGIPPAKISFSASEVSVQAGRTVAVPALKGTNIDASTLAGATFSSSKQSVLSVDWNEAEARWEMTGLKKGKAVLTARAGEASAEIKVSVVKSGEAASIRFENDLVYLKAGETFTPRVLDEYGSPVYATLASGDAGVVSVDGEGTLRAVSVGRAVITARLGDLSAEMTVEVCSGEIQFSLDELDLTLGVGQRYLLKPKVNGDGGATKLTYTSSDTAVATVSASGLIIARYPGAAVITVSDAGGASATCEVTVFPAPTLLEVTPASVSGSLSIGGAQLQWSFGASDEVGSVSFSTSDPDIATVNDEGYISFISVGAATVSAVTNNGLTAQVRVTVLPDKETTSGTRYRLFAAYSYFSTSYGKEYLPFSRNNGKSVAKVFEKSEIDGEGYSTKVMGNPGKTQLLSGISGFFSDTDDNDVSIVYLCTHGHNNKSSYTNYRMSLPGYSSNTGNANYYITASEIFNCVRRIRGSVVLILDSCYSGTFIEDMKSRLNAEDGRIAVLAAASNTRATFYNVKDTDKSVDFFTFFLLQGLGYSEKDGWWNGNASGGKGSYPGYLAADKAGNNDGDVTLGEFYDFASKCIAKNIPNYMKKSWYWGDKTNVQKTRFYAGDLKDLVIYRPE